MNKIKDLSQKSSEPIRVSMLVVHRLLPDVFIVHQQLAPGVFAIKNALGSHPDLYKVFESDLTRVYLTGLQKKRAFQIISKL